jgi:hypothetical protein
MDESIDWMVVFNVRIHHIGFQIENKTMQKT